MAVEGFTILDSVSTTISLGHYVFPYVVTFADVPTGITREIQVLIYAGISSILSTQLGGNNIH